MTMSHSTRRIATLAGAAALVLVLVWYVAVFRPQSAHLSAAHKAYAAAEQQIGQLHSQVASLQALERQIPADKARLAVLDQAVPASADLRDVLNQLHTLATGTGCELTTVNPSQSTSGSSSSSSSGSSPSHSITLSMTTTGNYAQLTSFLTGLARMPRSVVVDTVTISPGAGSQLAMTLSSRIFYT